jgi:HK97 family phage major capsid protein
MSNGMLKKARKWTDSQGRYLWQPAISQGQGSLDDQPVWEDPGLASPASATKSVLYGDWSSAVILKMMPLRVQISQDYRFNQDQLAVKCVLRVGAAVMDPAAAAALVSANT